MESSMALRTRRYRSERIWLWRASSVSHCSQYRMWLCAYSSSESQQPTQPCDGRVRSWIDRKRSITWGRCLDDGYNLMIENTTTPFIARNVPRRRTPSGRVFNLLEVSVVSGVSYHWRRQVPTTRSRPVNPKSTFRPIKLAYVAAPGSPMAISSFCLRLGMFSFCILE